jgi:hypothetical protein
LQGKVEETGDSHNFGQKVVRQGDWVLKPRPLFWEMLLLNSQSPLRKFTSLKANSARVINPFEWFPDLQFEFSPNSTLLSSGRVEYFDNNIITPAEEIESSKAFGALLANIFFWGITDLHVQNIGWGICKKQKKMVLFPLDIESIFFPIELISQTYFLKTRINNHSYVGIKNIESFKTNPALMLETFSQVIDFYLRFKDELLIELSKLEMQKYPIRCILKNTSIYGDHIAGSGEDLVFFKEELEQMDRGDVPYFFTYIGETKIFYLTKNGEKSVSFSWSDGFDKFKCDPITQANLFPNISGTNFDFNYLQILRNFDPKIDAQFESTNFKIRYVDDLIYLDNPNGKKLKCKRLL